MPTNTPPKSKWHSKFPSWCDPKPFLLARSHFSQNVRVGVFVWSESEEDSGSSSFEDNASEYSESDSDDGLEKLQASSKGSEPWVSINLQYVSKISAKSRRFICKCPWLFPNLQSLGLGSRKSGPQNLDYLNASFGSSPWLGSKPCLKSWCPGENMPNILAYVQGALQLISAMDISYGWNSKTVEALWLLLLLLWPSRENLARLALWLLVSKFREQYLLHTSYGFFLHTSFVCLK